MSSIVHSLLQTVALEVMKVSALHYLLICRLSIVLVSSSRPGAALETKHVSPVLALSPIVACNLYRRY